MGKKEKLVDLKPKVDKISDEHLKEMQNLVNTINSIQFNIGKMEIQKHSALKELAKQQDGVSALQDTLQKEYGSFDVNVTDGTINWPKEEDKKDEK